MTRILADYHHADLFESHQRVFGDRYGWQVFAPYGLDWFDRGYWAFEKATHGDAVARQYLLGIWRGAEPDANGIVSIPDTAHPGRTLLGISLDAALSLRWDVVLSTVPSNAIGLSAFARETGAVWGVHVGNQWGDEAWQREPAFAILTTTSRVPPGIPYVVVHQEFSLDDFRYEPPVGFGPVRSFVNCFPEMAQEYLGNFVPIARAYPEFGWEVFGAYGTAEPDDLAAGNLHGTPTIGAAMRAAGAIWHAKHWSDGFGHVIHNAFAVGRPVFGYARYYADKLAGPLWVEGVTSYDVEGRGREATVDLLRGLRDDPDRHLRMCEASAARFREVVSFDEDAGITRSLLDRVMSAVAA